MGKHILVAALAGWAGIVAFAWRMANARIALCYIHDEGCLIRTTAARDNLLIAGLTVALVGLVVLALVLSRRAQPFSGLRSANPASPARLR